MSRATAVDNTGQLGEKWILISPCLCLVFLGASAVNYDERDPIDTMTKKVSEMIAEWTYKERQ